MAGKGCRSEERRADLGRLARTLLSGHCGVLVFDRAGNCVYADEAAGSVYGVQPGDLLDRRIEEILANAGDERGAGLLSRTELEGEHEVTTAAGETRRLTFRMRTNFLPGLHMAIVREAPPRRADTVRDENQEPLSEREREILRLLATGLTGGMIAARLGLSPTTVQTHVRNAMRRLGAGTRTHAVMLALSKNEL